MLSSKAAAQKEEEGEQYAEITKLTHE